ncbi:MAG: metalloregulator ArsR/SmtB family transcription factor [Sphaerochaetaceae bacterium]|nr:metalloregulator ArsR/SmtB family transcription factor [Sphaerochaetaceae bacterium]
MTEDKISEICKALGDPNRLRIIKLLTDGQACANDLLEKFQITQPTLSHHMKILSETGLVTSRKEGKCTYYSITCCMFKEFKSYFEAISCYKDRAKDSSGNEQSCCHCGGR